MTSQERFKRMYEHREADRVPIIDSTWDATVQRWRKEGMPAGVDWIDYFGIDHCTYIEADNSPLYEVKTLEETEEYVILTTGWGATLKNWKHAASTPEFMDFTIVDEESWKAAKRRMTPSRDRVDFEGLKKNYKTWRKEGHWIKAAFWFGFDVTHSWAVGTERFLMALVEKPEWCVDMFNTFLDLDIALFEMVWNEGYRFDAIRWPDDLGYSHNQFMSLSMYREMLKPVHKRACDWAHAKGLKVELHSCGDVNPFIPEFIEIGIDCLNPIEVKAGMDPVAIKKRYGDRLTMRGGINSVLLDNPEKIEAEMRRVMPVLKQGGGYVFSSDHSVPSSVSLNDFKRIVALAKELGRY